MTDEAIGVSSETNRGTPEWMWQDYLNWGQEINQERMEADWKGLWDYAPPNAGASEETLARTEAQLGFRLPKSYRDFLKVADGWPCFYQDMTIFSTSDLLGGELRKLGGVQLELEECIEAMASDGVIAADHFMVAAAQGSIDIVLMGRPGTPAEGTASWVRGEVLGRYDDLLDYYLSMMEYNKLETVDLRKDFGPKPDGVPHAVVSRLDSPPVLEEARRNDL